MKKQQIIPYRGDLVSIRLALKAQKQRSLRKFKRNLLKVWDLSPKNVYYKGNYGHTDILKALGLSPTFLNEHPNQKDIKGLVILLSPSASPSQIKNLSDEEKKLFYKRAFRIFNKYGTKLHIAYKVVETKEKVYDGGDGDGPSTITRRSTEIYYRTFDYDSNTKQYNETFFEEADKELANILYYRIALRLLQKSEVMDLGEIEEFKNTRFKDFPDSVVYKYTKKLKESSRWKDKESLTATDYELIKVGDAFTYKSIQVKHEDIQELIKQELFTGNGSNIDLYRAFINSGFNSSLINKNLWTKIQNKGIMGTIRGPEYILNIEAVKKLDPEAFFIFIQTSLSTSVDPVKKWWQRGPWPTVTIVIGMVVIVLSLGSDWGIGWTLIGIGMGLALIGIGMEDIQIIKVGRITMLVGSVINLTKPMLNTFLADVVEETAKEAVRQGVARGVAQRIAEKIAEETLLNQMLGVASQTLSYIGQAYTYISPFVQAYRVYEQFQNIFNQKMAEAPNLNETPEEATRSIFMAENDYWDFINKQFPEYIIPATLKVM